MYHSHSNGQESYVIGKGLSHIIPILDTMGDVWSDAKSVAVP